MLRTVVVLGAQWGDEGKGKLVETVAGNSAACVRFNGGANAGHTLIVDGKKLACHALPCGIVHPSCTNVLGHGMVVNLQSLVGELTEAEGVLKRKAEGKDLEDSLVLSSRAHLVFRAHLLADAAQEKQSDKAFIGTTLRGIGPSYATKALRLGLRASDLLLDDAAFAEKFHRLHSFLIQSYNLKDIDVQQELNDFLPLKARFARCVKDLSVYWEELAAQLKDGKVAKKEEDKDANLTTIPVDIVAEGANATFLDLDLGTYPYCTSSSCTVCGVGNGASLDVRRLWKVVGVMKAYLTRVGQGPMPTEDFGAIGEALCVRGGEFGASTGRRRRCGWLDLVMMRFSIKVNGFDELMMTKLDILSGISERDDTTGVQGIKYCVSYMIDGKRTEHFPSSIEELEKVTPVYETMPGWTEDLSLCESFDDFPQAAKDYVRKIEHLLQVPITLIGTGPARHQIIYRKPRQ